jgi:hypothetical protein
MGFPHQGHIETGIGSALAFGGFHLGRSMNDALSLRPFSAFRFIKLLWVSLLPEFSSNDEFDELLFPWPEAMLCQLPFSWLRRLRAFFLLFPRPLPAFPLLLIGSPSLG